MSTSPLLFARDGRTLPFIPVTVAAMVAIRERIPRRRPVAVSTYMALLEFANEARADRAAVTQREIVERVGAGRTSVQQALEDLRDAGLLVVNERRHGGARLENEYVVIEPDQELPDTAPSPATRATPPPATQATVARHTGEGRPPHGQLTQEGEKEEKERERKDARPDPREQVPDGFPDEVRPHARIVMATLKRVAAAHPQARKVWPEAVGRVVMNHPRRPLVKVAQALEVWAIDPPRPILDVVATYRTFLERERDLEATEALAPDGVPLNGTASGGRHSAAEPSTGSATLRNMAADIRAGAKPR